MRTDRRAGAVDGPGAWLGAWPAAAMYLLLALAGTVPGGVFVVQLSHTMLFSMSYISAQAVCMAALPGLSHAAHRDDAVTFGSTWRQSLSYTVTGELRHAALIGPLATCLAVVAIAQLVSGVYDISRQALFARLDDRIPRRASEVAFGGILVAGAATLLLPADGSRLIWLVVAIMAGELAAAGTVLTRLHRTIRPERFLEPRALIAAVVAALALVPVSRRDLGDPAVRCRRPARRSRSPHPGWCRSSRGLRPGPPRRGATDRCWIMTQTRYRRARRVVLN
ncbi:MAG: hypothetical protein ACRDRO_17515 [Pseudonocardiaceae bacterium]